MDDNGDVGVYYQGNVHDSAPGQPGDDANKPRQSRVLHLIHNHHSTAPKQNVQPAPSLGAEHAERRGSIFDVIWNRRKRQKSVTRRPDSEAGSDSDSSTATTAAASSFSPSKTTSTDPQTKPSQLAWRSEASAAAIDEAELREIEFDGGQDADVASGVWCPAIVRPNLGRPPIATVARATAAEDGKTAADKKHGLNWQQRVRRRIHHGLTFSHHNNNHHGSSESHSGDGDADAVFAGSSSAAAGTGNSKTDTDSDCQSTDGVPSRRRHTLKDGVRRLKIPFLSKDRLHLPRKTTTPPPDGSSVLRKDPLARHKMRLSTADGSHANWQSVDHGDDMLEGSCFRSRAASDTSSVQACRQRAAQMKLTEEQESVDLEALINELSAAGDAPKRLSSNLQLELPRRTESGNGESNAPQRRRLPLAARKSAPITIASARPPGDTDILSDRVKPRVHFSASDTGDVVADVFERMDSDDVTDAHAAHVTSSPSVSRQRTVSMPNLTDKDDYRKMTQFPTAASSRTGRMNSQSGSPAMVAPSGGGSGTSDDTVSVHTRLSDTTTPPVEQQTQPQLTHVKKHRQPSGGNSSTKDSKLRRATSVIDQPVLIVSTSLMLFTSGALCNVRHELQRNSEVEFLMPLLTVQVGN
jgi:hypothetical protein